jgi:hypothetical protein
MKKLIAASALLALSAAAHAQYHFIIAPGAGHAKVDCSRTENKCVSDNLGDKIMFGVDVSDHFAVEFSFIDFGRFTTSAPASVKAYASPTNPGVAEESVNAKAWGANLAYRYEFLPRLSAIGRLGLAYVRSHESGSTFDYKNEAHKLEPTLGAALNVALPLGLSVQLAYDRTRAEYGGDHKAVALYSLGAVMDF